MMDDPNFLQQMNEAMENPMFQQMLTNHPMLRDNPMLQQAMRNPEMRRMMFNPQMLRLQLQMQQQQMNAGGAFPAPGVTDTTPGPNATTPSTNPSQPPQHPLDMFGAAGAGAGAQPNAANPFAALFGPGATNPFAPPSNTTPATSPPPTASAGQDTPANPTPSTQSPNPFANLFGTGAQPGASGGSDPLAQMTQQLMQNPEAMRAAMQMFGGMGGEGAAPAGGAAAGNPFGNLFGPGGMGAGGFGEPRGGATAPPADTRPPEEIYASQLGQLNDMGFYEFERNVQALRRSGGSVQGAIEFLLGGS
jgi:ubiquilin